MVHHGATITSSAQPKKPHIATNGECPTQMYDLNELARICVPSQLKVSGSNAAQQSAPHTDEARVAHRKLPRRTPKMDQHCH